jgi:hypothetical protein
VIKKLKIIEIKDIPRPYMTKTQKLNFKITPENEKQLREKNRKRGDISNTINQALEQYFKKESEQ